MKIALIGYGKMGKEIERIALSRGHEIVSVIDKDNQTDFDSEAFRSADVAIEFTAPSAAYGNCLKAFDAGVKVVSGSTGWMNEHGDEMKKRCREEGKTLFWASNFSIGVAIFSAVNKYLARIMDNFPGYDVSMSETHHVHKLDAPSGTAITLAEGIIDNLSTKRSWVNYAPGVEQAAHRVASPAEVAPDQIEIDSRREGMVPGIHTVTYESEDDILELSHTIKNRRTLALGAVIAAEFLCGKRGVFGMDDLLQ